MGFLSRSFSQASTIFYPAEFLMSFSPPGNHYSDELVGDCEPTRYA